MIEIINIIKFPYYGKLPTDSLQSLSKFQCHRVKAVLAKNEARGIMCPDFKLCHKAIVIKPTWHWHKHGRRDQWNKIENPEINSCLYGQFVAKDPRIYNEERKVPLIKGAGKTGQPYAEE